MANQVTTPMLISFCAADDIAAAHIPWSINITSGSFFQVIQLAKLPPRDRLIVTYCDSGTSALRSTSVQDLWATRRCNWHGVFQRKSETT
ncbi:MAG: hypothetical protein CO065_13540 [Comamonadaceae bacterium CG_4_9_14_0_8_um_filter_57_21]|nr:MAG: hypothetical protein CO065_13540 [Comamonadaceae bacterium CG_4_9_14_0_8_um_filter_57_21]